MHFTIRDLLWLMVVVGMGAGWLADHRAAARRAEDADALWQSMCYAILEKGWATHILPGRKRVELMPHDTDERSTLNEPIP